MKYLFSTLNFYFSRLFLMWLGICCITIMSVVSLFEATEYARRAGGRAHVGTSLILEMVFLRLPQHLELLLPFMVLLATILSFWRLHHSGEIAVARSSGVSIWQYASGLSFVIIILSVVDLVVLNPIAAAMTSRLKNLEAITFSGQENRLAISETGLWLREAHQAKSQPSEGQPSRQSIFHAKSANLKEDSFYDVSFYQFSEAGKYLETINAKKAILKDGYWELTNVNQWRDETVRELQTFKIPTELTIHKIQDGQLSPQSISFWQISDYIGILDKSGLSTTGYRLYWHAHLSKVGFMISMVLLGLAFSLRHPARSINLLSIGSVLSLGLLIYFMRDVVYALGLADKIPVMLASWTPAVVTALLASTLILHLEDG
ncbi:MAG: LptF/LptG family permease [Alphaproteobacteria bacterium]